MRCSDVQDRRWPAPSFFVAIRSVFRLAGAAEYGGGTGTAPGAWTGRPPHGAQGVDRTSNPGKRDGCDEVGRVCGQRGFSCKRQSF